MGGEGSGKEYLLYTCENVDNCEQSLSHPWQIINAINFLLRTDYS